jgi:DNA-binding transcriptional MerR regulator
MMDATNEETMNDRPRDLQLSIGELARAAGVSVRTVRYYIAEGLLPPAEESGPKAAYGRAHLDRLHVIGQMKGLYLPLREIRRQLAGMVDEEIHELAEQALETGVEEALDRPPPLMAPPPERTTRQFEVREDAASYIANLRRQPPSAPAPRPRHGPTPREPTERAWRRIPLGDEGELLIADEAYQRRKEQIEALVDWAKRILS